MVSRSLSSMRTKLVKRYALPASTASESPGVRHRSRACLYGSAGIAETTARPETATVSYCQTCFDSGHNLPLEYPQVGGLWIDGQRKRTTDPHGVCPPLKVS